MPPRQVEHDHAEDAAAGGDQLARPGGRRDVAVADAVEGDEGPPVEGDVGDEGDVEGDEGPPEGVAHRLVAGLVVQPLLEQEDGEGGEEEDNRADVGGGEQLLPVEVHHVREHQPHLPSPVDPKHGALPFFLILRPPT